MKDVAVNNTAAVDDARFYLQIPHRGKTLIQCLWAMMTKLNERPPAPPKLWRKGCFHENEANAWTTFRPPLLKEGSFSYFQHDPARNAQFSVAEIDDSSPLPQLIDIYWVGGHVQEKLQPEAEDNVGKWHAQLVYQGSIGGTQPPLRRQTYVGHQFVAAARSTTGDSAKQRMCALEVWVVAQSESSEQHFVLDPSSSRVKDTARTVPGLMPCRVGSENSSKSDVNVEVALPADEAESSRDEL